ncbi:MAG: ribonuclease H-like domain-containing protein [Eubacterium sp.]|nr:ribonuclease H-like domain-containing protein [Eubacterium sp.]
MKRFLDEFELDEFRSRVLDTYFSGCTICSYDIETTGLFPRSDRIMLTGLLTVKDGRASARQFFSESPGDEKAVIEATLNALKDADVILTYNGRSFDTPFTIARAEHYGIEPVMPYDLDLFTVVSGYSEIKRFTGSLSQKSIEKFMGKTPSRDDRIDGRESIRLYEQYLSNPSYALEKTIMLHNHDDICQLYRIFPVIRQTDFHRAMFRMGFPAGEYTIKKISVSRSGLSVTALRRKNSVDYISFPTEDKPYSIRSSSSDGITELDIPGEIINGDVLVIDVKKILGSLDKDPAGILDELSRYPSYSSGYLILKNNGRINYFETNIFIRKFFELLTLSLHD